MGFAGIEVLNSAGDFLTPGGFHGGGIFRGAIQTLQQRARELGAFILILGRIVAVPILPDVVEEFSLGCFLGRKGHGNRSPAAPRVVALANHQNIWHGLTPGSDCSNTNNYRQIRASA